MVFIILSIINNCNDASLANILASVKRIMLLIQIIVPIMLIVWGSYGMFQMMHDPDKKNGIKSIVNKFIAAIIIFMIPVFINVTIGLVGDSYNFSSCWNNAQDIVSGTSVYVPEDDSDRRKEIISSKPYDYGKPKSSTNNSSASNSTGSSKTSSSRVVFIGDSRTVQMYAYTSGDWSGANYSSGGVHEVGDDVYVAEGSMGLSWLQSTGIPAAKKYFNSAGAVVILMGVNDLYRVNDYISYLNDNVASWESSGCSVYFVSVNPCSGSYDSLNSKIESFNDTMKSSLSKDIGYIDTYSSLISSGFNATDGLHYDGDTYSKIYNYIKSNV